MYGNDHVEQKVLYNSMYDENVYQDVRSLSKASRCVSVDVHIAGHFIVQAVAEALVLHIRNSCF